MLTAYCAGRTGSIPALEGEILLPFAGSGDGESVLYNYWLYTAIVYPKS